MACRPLCAAALPQISEAKLFPGVLRPSRSLTHTHRVALEAAGVEKSSPPAILLQIVTSRVKHCNKLVHRRDCGQRNTFTAMPTPTAGFQYGRRIFKRQNIRNFWSFMIYRNKQVQLHFKPHSGGENPNKCKQHIHPGRPLEEAF